ncbi:MAG: LolA family protein [Trichloromonadaceae bacterium]
MKKLLLLLTLLLAPALALAAPAKEQIGLSDVIKTLETPFKAEPAKSGAIRDFEADFFQESRIASLDRIQRGRGRVSVKFDPQSGERVSRTKFRWEYSQPTTQEIVSDGRTLWVYLPENRQVIQSDIDLVNQSRSEDPMTFLTGLGNLSRDFLISWASPNTDAAGNYALELRPRRASALIHRLLMVVDREAVLSFRRGETGRILPIRASTVIDPSENSTTIEFSNVRVNRGQSDSAFNFILPAGVEVVRPQGMGLGN